MTSSVDGATALGSQLAAPWEEPSETSAATRPMLVCTSMATTLEPLPIEERDSVTVWCGGTVIPVSLPAWAWPASVMTLTSTLAASESTFIRSSWICAAPFCCPGPTNQMSEPGSLQRILAIPELCASSASIAWAMVPLADTDQPSATEAPFLVVLDPAGTVSSESTPGPCVRTGPVARSGTPAGGSAVSSTWPTVAGPAAPAAPAAPAISATGPDPLPWAGG